MGPRFLVIGCGGIGGIVAANLLDSGHDVTAVTTNAAIADAVRESGFQLRGDGGTRTVLGNIHVGVPKERFDYVLLCTQPPSVEDAARTALSALTNDGAMVCFQNGLCERRIARIAGDAHTLGAVVAWGAAMPEPGVYDRTASGGFTVGRLDGASDERLEVLAAALEAIGPTEVTPNLAGKRWSKLAINCAISSLGTIGADRLGPLMSHRFVRRLGLDIMSEVVSVARAERVKLEKVSGTIDLEWVALTEDERRASGSPSLLAKHTLLLAVGFRYRRMRSSMLSAIERGRTPAVDFLNGEVVDHAKLHGIATPVNALVHATVWRIARGEATPGLALLREVYDASGPRGADVESA